MAFGECDLIGSINYQASASTSRMGRATIQRPKRNYEHLESGFFRKDPLVDSDKEALGRRQEQGQNADLGTYRVRSGK